MKKYLIVFFLLGSFLYAKVNTVVSILPQKTFVEAIGGDKVDVALMVKPGNSPHTYEPKPSQMKQISRADIYFTIGVEFEDSWLPRFTNQNKKMKLIDLTKGINKLAMEAHHHHEHEAHEEDEDDHEEHHEDTKHEDEHKPNSLDPHVWTSPDNIKTIAKNILDSLVDIDRENKNYYINNFKKFIKHIEDTDEKIKKIFINTPKDSKFMVFHPSWGYFANQYLLVQMPIELEGKNPKPKAIAKIIEYGKKEGVKAVFTNPEVSETLAIQIAKELGVPVIKVSPLDPNWSENLISLAKAIANK